MMIHWVFQKTVLSILLKDSMLHDIVCVYKRHLDLVVDRVVFQLKATSQGIVQII